MKTSTLPILHEDEHGFRFIDENEKVTCNQRNKFKGDLVWIDENGLEYFRVKSNKRFYFKKLSNQ